MVFKRTSIQYRNFHGSVKVTSLRAPFFRIVMYFLFLEFLINVAWVKRNKESRKFRPCNILRQQHIPVITGLPTTHIVSRFQLPRNCPQKTFICHLVRGLHSSNMQKLFTIVNRKISSSKDVVPYQIEDEEKAKGRLR